MNFGAHNRLWRRILQTNVDSCGIRTRSERAAITEQAASHAMQLRRNTIKHYRGGRRPWRNRKLRLRRDCQVVSVVSQQNTLNFLFRFLSQFQIHAALVARVEAPDNDISFGHNRNVPQRCCDRRK